MNKLTELLAKGHDVTIGQHSDDLTGFFIHVGFPGEGLWEGSSHGDTLEDAVQNALDRSNGDPETLYKSEDFEPDPPAGRIPEDDEQDSLPDASTTDNPIAHASNFRKELQSLLNQHNQENRSNTPDWILRDYICSCLMAFDCAIRTRDAWYDLNLQPGCTVGEES